MPALKDPRFLLISLGNPLPKYASLHSAAHYVLPPLATLLHNPPFTSTKPPSSIGSKYTLLQSPTLMNVSGTFVSSAWKDFSRKHSASALIIIHDEMELALGKVKLRAWDGSHKGHNGVRSCKVKLKQGESPFVRIAVGIGRPLERDPETVSKYVLAPIKPEERRVFEEDVPLRVVECLGEIEREWREVVEEEG